MDTEGPYKCKKCSKEFEETSYSSPLICDACIESVEPWKMRASGIGCLVFSLLSFLAGIGICFGVYETVVEEDFMSMIGQYKLVGIIALALLGLGIFGMILSVRVFFDTKGGKPGGAEDDA